MRSTTTQRHIAAPREAVYRALIDERAIARWRVPEGMTAEVHSFNPREGGRFRVSLTYDAPDRTGKTAGRTDTYHGHFAELVENERVVEVIEFESEDPALQGEMRVTTTLAAADDGTHVVLVHERIPPGVSLADNEMGTRMSLDKLAIVVETG